MRFLPVVSAVAFLVPDVRAGDNPWTERVAPAVQAAHVDKSVDAIATALDVAYRADDWQAGLELIDLAQHQHPDADAFVGRRLRALWRGGRILDAEALAERAPKNITDRIALAALVQIELARGHDERAIELAHRLEAQGDPTAFEIYLVLTVRILDNRLDGVGRMLRRATELAKPENGYPDNILAEVLEGLPQFFEALGGRPLNCIDKFGSVEMPAIAGFGLPSCSATINGKGPYRLIVDTGGSIAISLDKEIADEIGLKSISTSTIHGVNGPQESSQCISDRVRIGDIECSNVMTQSFQMPAALRGMADGILGTGVFADGRMTLDLAGERLTVAPSGDKPGAGDEMPMRIVGDAKFVTFVELEGKPGVALLDSGADAIALSPSTARRLFPDKEFQQVQAGIAAGVGSGEQTGILFLPPVDVKVGGHMYDDFGGIGLEALDSLLAPILGVQFDVLIGMPLFRDLKTFTVDFKTCKAWIEWLPEKD